MPRNPARQSTDRVFTIWRRRHGWGIKATVKYCSGGKQIIMHRPIRRKERATATGEAALLLKQCSYGTLATAGSDGQPYATPLSYVFLDNHIYLHCAPEGQKLDNIRQNPAVSFCVVGHTRTLPEQFSTIYESAIVSGIASEVAGAEKQHALEALINKYAPEFSDRGLSCISDKIDRTVVIKIRILHMSGKARRN